MTSCERGTEPRADKRDYLEFLTGFIRQAHAFEVTTAVYGQYVDSLKVQPTDTFSPHMVFRASTEQITENIALVNSCIRELGFITFMPPNARLMKPLTLVSWHGSDPRNPDNHLWQTREMPGSVISVPAQDQVLIEQSLLAATNAVV